MIDAQKLEAFMGKFVCDLGAVLHAPLVLIGAELGLYRVLAKAGPLAPADLAAHTETDPRYVREWLCANAAAGYVDYHAESGTFAMNPEQAHTLADPESPAYLPGAFKIGLSMFRDQTKVARVFKTGTGMGWHEHDHSLFEGTEEFFRPGYAGNLVSSWLPALDGVVPKLERGASVADIGCGHGSSTIIMAAAYPASRFVGFDYHEPSIDAARRAAERAGVGDRVRFEIAPAKSYPGLGYDLVTSFDCLHDMGDPTGAATHVLASLAREGTWMIVEPNAGDRIEDNLNPVGRVFYSASTMICTPASRSQEVGLALGAQAGESRLRDVVTAGGFSRFRRATATPFNLILEARP